MKLKSSFVREILCRFQKRRLPHGLLLILPVALMFFAGCETPGPRRISMWKDEVSPEGWKGKRYYENNLVMAEEFDSVGNDGRIDMWRFYERGKLLLDERDRDGDGRIDYTAQYDTNEENLISLARDTDFNGTPDLWVKYDGRSRWVQNWDRNSDGMVDFSFSFVGEPSRMSRSGADFFEVTDMRLVIEQAMWQSIVMDRNFDGIFDTWVAFSKGGASEVGTDINLDGRADNWVAVSPDTLTPESRVLLREAFGPVFERAQNAGGDEHAIIERSPPPLPAEVKADNYLKEEIKKIRDMPAPTEKLPEDAAGIVMTTVNERPDNLPDIPAESKPAQVEPEPARPKGKNVFARGIDNLRRFFSKFKRRSATGDADENGSAKNSFPNNDDNYGEEPGAPRARAKVRLMRDEPGDTR